MKKTTKMMLFSVVIVLIASVALVALGNVSKGFQLKPSEWKLKEVNEDNLYQSLVFGDNNGVWASGEDGVSVKLDEEDNSIKVKGTAEKDVSYLIGTTTLKSGTSYIFDSSLDEGSNQTVYVSIVNKSTGEVIKSSYRDAVLIPADDITADTEVTIKLTIKAETEVNATLRIVLCEGTDVEDIVDFYK